MAMIPRLPSCYDKLHQALNPGGDAPSDADRTALLQSALDDLKGLSHNYRGHRVAAMVDIKTALHEIQNNDLGHAAADIAEADREVRILEE